MLQSHFQAIFRVQIFIPDKYTGEVKINVTATSKRLKFHGFMVSLNFGKTVKKKEKNNPSRASPRRIGKSHPLI